MTEIIEGQARDVTASAVTVAQPQQAVTVAPAIRDPLRALGTMSEADYKAEVKAIIAGTNRMMELQKDLLRGPEYDSKGNLVKEGVDYGVIPGTGKPTLLQPGAERLAMFHRLIPEHRITRTITPVPGHPDRIDIDCECVLHQHNLEGPIIQIAHGATSSYEDRYRWRIRQRTCPTCNAPAIIKGKAEWGGGWLCHQKRGGCGAKFKDGYAPIENQPTGREENDEPYALLNTLVQMAQKRAFVAAVRHALGITDLFTEEIEEPRDDGPAQTAQEPPPPAPRANTPPRSAPRQDAPSRPPAQGVVTFEGPVVTPPDGIRSTAGGRQLRFAIKVGNSKHWIELYDDLAVAAEPHVKEGARIRVDGTRHDEDWPGRGDKALMKVIRDVTIVALVDEAGTRVIAEAASKPPQPVQQPLMADDGPPLFDDDVLPAPKPVEPVLQTRDPAEPTDATVDITGTIRSISWQQTPNGHTVAYLEIVVGADKLFKVAMKQDDAHATIADPTGEFIVGAGGSLRVMGGWNPKGTMLLAGIAVPL